MSTQIKQRNSPSVAIKILSVIAGIFGFTGALMALAIAYVAMLNGLPGLSYISLIFVAYFVLFGILMHSKAKSYRKKDFKKVILLSATIICMVLIPIIFCIGLITLIILSGHTINILTFTLM